jgi:hypothetical protein
MYFLSKNEYRIFKPVEIYHTDFQITEQLVKRCSRKGAEYA